MPRATNEIKECCRCREIKLITEFSKRNRTSDGLSSYCRECEKIENKKLVDKYKTSNNETFRANKAKASKKHSNKIKQTLFDVYGRKCACCGETTEEFLTLEHIKGQNGKKYKSGYEAWKEAIKEYKPDLYEVLCMNCNFVKRRGK